MTCLLTPGWTCEELNGVNSTCVPPCPNTFIEGNEVCDGPNPGCAPDCSASLPGYSCPQVLHIGSGKMQSMCTIDCSIGLGMPGGFPCSDNNFIDLDGCHNNCTIQAGFSCLLDPSGTYSICSEFCGNGVIGSGEICDDGNSIDGDGCSN